MLKGTVCPGNGWYHVECSGLTAAQANTMTSFICASCSAASKKVRATTLSLTHANKHPYLDKIHPYSFYSMKYSQHPKATAQAPGTPATPSQTPAGAGAKSHLNLQTPTTSNTVVAWHEYFSLSKIECRTSICNTTKQQLRFCRLPTSSCRSSGRLHSSSQLLRLALDTQLQHRNQNVRNCRLLLSLLLLRPLQTSRTTIATFFQSQTTVFYKPRAPIFPLQQHLLPLASLLPILRPY